MKLCATSAESERSLRLSHCIFRTSARICETILFTLAYAFGSSPLRTSWGNSISNSEFSRSKAAVARLSRDSRRALGVANQELKKWEASPDPFSGLLPNIWQSLRVFGPEWHPAMRVHGQAAADESMMANFSGRLPGIRSVSVAPTILVTTSSTTEREIQWLDRAFAPGHV